MNRKIFAFLLCAVILASCATKPETLAPFAISHDASNTRIAIEGGNDTIINWVDFSLDKSERVRDHEAPFEQVYDHEQLKPGWHRVDVWVSLEVLGSNSVVKRSKRFKVTSAQPEPTQPPEPLVLFYDDFEGSELDSKKWQTCYPWTNAGNCYNAGTGETQVYLPDNVKVSDGTLHLITKREDYCANGECFEYTSGMVSTYGRFAHTGGRLEARIKFPKGRGLWGAFWSLPVTTDWPPEIDVIEVLGRQTDVAHMHFHSKTKGHTDRGYSYRDVDLTEDFHTYAVDWKPPTATQEGVIVWYVDGVERARYSGRDVPDEPMYLLLNLAVGGSWAGAPKPDTLFPSRMEIDWVRVTE
jgi:beta-glucanase (GH16 family)